MTLPKFHRYLRFRLWQPQTSQGSYILSMKWDLRREKTADMVSSNSQFGVIGSGTLADGTRMMVSGRAYAGHGGAHKHAQSDRALMAVVTFQNCCTVRLYIARKPTLMVAEVPPFWNPGSRKPQGQRAKRADSPLSFHLQDPPQPSFERAATRTTATGVYGRTEPSSAAFRRVGH